MFYIHLIFLYDDFVKVCNTEQDGADGAKQKLSKMCFNKATTQTNPMIENEEHKV